jgi:sec-independent protein translocase protein TatC
MGSEAMPLAEHLRELRKRLIVSVLSIGLGFIPSWVYYPQIFAFLEGPFASLEDTQTNVSLVLGGVADPFTLQIQVSSVAAIVLSSPIWLTQVWRFITPGLYRNEKKWTLLFVFSAVPMILLGIFSAYFVMPIGLQVLLGFTPSDVENLIAVDRYFDFFFRITAVFAIGYLIPLVFIMLNFAGLLLAQTIRSWWRGILMSVMLFGAIATPTGDPVNMLLVSLPITLLIIVAWFICAANDIRRRRRNKSIILKDDEATPIEEL